MKRARRSRRATWRMTSGRRYFSGGALIHAIEPHERPGDNLLAQVVGTSRIYPERKPGAVAGRVPNRGRRRKPNESSQVNRYPGLTAFTVSVSPKSANWYDAC